MILIVLTSIFATSFQTVDERKVANGTKGWVVQVFENTFSLTAFVTYEDKAAFIATIGYVLYYCVRVQVRPQD